MQTVIIEKIRKRPGWSVLVALAFRHLESSLVKTSSYSRVLKPRYLAEFVSLLRGHPLTETFVLSRPDRRAFNLMQRSLLRCNHFKLGISAYTVCTVHRIAIAETLLPHARSRILSTASWGVVPACGAPD